MNESDDEVQQRAGGADEIKKKIAELESKIAHLETENKLLITEKDQKYSQIINEIKKISQATPKEIEVEITKGKGIIDNPGQYEAEVKLEGKKVGTFSPVGCYSYDDKIYIYNHLKPNESVTLPQQYHNLKVIETEEEGYKLAFCTEYGHEYHEAQGDYRFIGIKSIENIDLAKHYNKNGSCPSFIIRASHNGYPGSEQHGVDIYDNKEQKIGSLIDEFGYYDVQNKFHYTNYQMGTKNHSYDPPLSFTITRGDNQCQSHKMKTNGTDHNLSNNTIDCSLVEHIANDVNSII